MLIGKSINKLSNYTYSRMYTLYNQTCTVNDYRSRNTINFISTMDYNNRFFDSKIRYITNINKYSTIKLFARHINQRKGLDIKMRYMNKKKGYNINANKSKF